MPALIQAQNISVRRNRKDILKQVSLDVDEGDFVTIVGPNGAGKSYLLECLLKLHKPSEGKVIWRDGLRIGYVPQRFGVGTSMPLTTSGFLLLRNRASQAELDDVVRDTAIAALLPRMVAELSAGEWQCVLLARALLRKPNILILDEPAQNLDVTGQLKFYQMLQDIYDARNIAILMVSHDLHVVMSRSRRVVCLYQHVCCSGSPQAVSRDPAFVELFGEDMARLTAVYQHDHDHDHTHSHSHTHTQEGTNDVPDAR